MVAASPREGVGGRSQNSQIHRNQTKGLRLPLREGMGGGSQYSQIHRNPKGGPLERQTRQRTGRGSPRTGGWPGAPGLFVLPWGGGVDRGGGPEGPPSPRRLPSNSVTRR